MEEKEKETVKFSGHENQISSIVRLCLDGELFTDTELICEDGSIYAHRIVLGAVSQFLCTVLRNTPACGLTSIVLPGVKRDVAQQLVQFVYSGCMQLSKFNSWGIQELVTLLQIDPQNVVVDVVDDHKIMKLAQSVGMESLGEGKPKMRVETKDAPLKNEDRGPSGGRRLTCRTAPPSERVRFQSGSDVRVSSPKSPSASPQTGNSPRTSLAPSPRQGIRNRTSSGRCMEDSRGSEINPGRGTGDPTVSSTGEFMSIVPSENLNVIKIVSSRKRRRSQEPSFQSTKEPQLDSQRQELYTEGEKNYHDTRNRVEFREEGNRCRGKVGFRTRGRARSRGTNLPRVKGMERGRHDMKNVETWVCAICGRYDPVLPGGREKEGDTTEWIGCDCNRWFHKFCTKLKNVDDSFSCKLVHKTCLIHHVN